MFDADGQLRCLRVTVCIGQAFPCSCQQESLLLPGPGLTDQIQTDPGTGERKMKAVACGLGEMDYSAVVDFAVRYKPYIHATMENTLPENAVAAREFIEGLEKKALENLN